MQQLVDRPPSCALLAGGRPTRLADLDALPEVNLGLFFFADVRPLQGVAGLVDWRLCGALSAALARQIVSGCADELTLLPTRGRLGQRRLFLYGLGELDDWRPVRTAAAVRAVCDAVRRAGGGSLALVAPAALPRPQVEGDFVERARRHLPDDVAVLCRAAHKDRPAG